MPRPIAGMHRRLLVLVGIIVAGTAAAMVSLWPSSLALPDDEGIEPATEGRIVEVVESEGDADPFTGETATVATITVEVLEGPAAGELRTMEPVPTELYPPLRVGDRIDLERVTLEGQDEYFIQDFDRGPALLGLAALFVIAVLAVGRWYGLRSLLGLAISLLIIVRFVVPAILDGRSPPLVAMVGATAIMIVTLYLAHGVNEMTTAAVVGTAVALGLTIVLALGFIDLGRITGLASDDAVLARFSIQGLDLRGLVLAGLIIAALGVLDDVTVSQASTVFALHDTDPTLRWRPLFRRAMRVGRDHIASVVNTLVLAYAGASLALLVLFSTGGRPVGEIVNSELLAEEIIKTLVGSVGLIAAVPLTTALATTIALQRGEGAPTVSHGHVHGPLPGHTHAPEPVDDDERARRSWARYLADREGGDTAGSPEAPEGSEGTDGPEAAGGGPEDGPPNAPE